MKISEMNAHQKTAYLIMREEYNNLVGGCENTLLDYSEDSEEYQAAHRTLHDHEVLRDMIYGEAIATANCRHHAIHMRFAGKEWLFERIDNRLENDGY